MKNRWFFFLVISSCSILKTEAVGTQESTFNVHKNYDGLPTNNSIQIETKEMQEGHDLYQKLHQENSSMIEGDQQIMKEGYDPNEVYDRNDPNKEYRKKNFEKQESEIYGK